ncbi:MAG: 50S ribosomal protein L4 [Nitrososphaerota archaeon]|nr:50S ribosomal protein L4 [Candidatus Calditenuaceae archaeon]MDW8072684.1 50S ribosomal protein L4 [Nitrososphaerota archaeon]
MTLLGQLLKVERRKVALRGLDGSVQGEVFLPAIFSAKLREDIVRRAYLFLLSHRFQPKGPWKGSGHKYSVESLGPGYGIARIARLKVEGTGKTRGGGFVPTAVGGRPTHPPTPEKNIHKRLNEREKRAALASAVAFTSSVEHVRKRGHRLPENIQLPLILDDSLSTVKKTSELLSILKAQGLEEELERCREVKIRAGKGKRRGRRYKRRRGPLIVVHEDEGVLKAASNIPGLDVVLAKDLSVLDLAPGGHPGRLTIYTLSSLQVLEKRLMGGGTSSRD